MEVGSWTDHGSIGIPANSDYNKIDPNLFQYSSSSPFYLSFGSYWNGIFQTPMQTPPTQVSGGDIVHLEQNTTARPDSLPVDPNEGSYQLWWNVDGTDYYYLFFSSGTCCNEPPDLVPQGEEYKVMVCRSTEPTGAARRELCNRVTLLCARCARHGRHDALCAGERFAALCPA